ncbi:hypothetical protein BH20CHL7_BH20CHL7_19690 [soil metagenome]
MAYLAAGGIGVAVFALLMTWRAGESILGAGGETAVGFYVWMIGSWAVAGHATTAGDRDANPAASTSRHIGRLVATAA